MLLNKTSKSHYNKYERLTKELNITFKNTNTYLGYSKEELLQLYLIDNCLTNIPGNLYRGYYDGLMKFNKKARVAGLTIWECACIAKHCLVYEVLGAHPVFDG